MVAMASGSDSARVAFTAYPAVEPYILEMCRPCLVAINIVSQQVFLVRKCWRKRTCPSAHFELGRLVGILEILDEKSWGGYG